jgi:hypothetical protein
VGDKAGARDPLMEEEGRWFEDEAGGSALGEIEGDLMGHGGRNLRDCAAESHLD